MTDSRTLVHCKALTLGFQRPLLGPLNLRVQAGERHLLTGPNGSGKSLLLQALVGRAQVFAGELHLADSALSYLAQEHPRPTPWPLSGRDWFSAMQAPVPDSPLIQPLLNKRLDRLSGGQWQLLRLAAVVQSALSAKRPALVLLDEPSNHLDAEVRATAVQLIHAMPATSTLLLTSHDQQFMAALGFTATPMEQLLESA
ncbi:ATP-binding cassette domain-containing protein [Halopseudomonas salegens]|uniref:ABC transporter n=1 Tax=Halopseudomonas salegens TaxID=1434072 RepID=A0A1H2FFH9_9GAMM|nr:ATP-binding cassette domain-containing protein [Halopseudomonas salegens]SDU06033.1 ABC transporter [Halopseudomonas salegens]